MSNQRASLNLDTLNSEATPIDLTELAGKSTPHNKSVNIHEIERVAEASGFVSRISSKRRLKPRSPFVVQHNFKMRLGMDKIFQEIGARLKVYDHTTFEHMVLALLEKEQMTDLISQFREITE